MNKCVSVHKKSNKKNVKVAREVIASLLACQLDVGVEVRLALGMKVQWEGIISSGTRVTYVRTRAYDKY